jgi:hypothetical protein
VENGGVGVTHTRRTEYKESLVEKKRRRRRPSTVLSGRDKKEPLESKLLDNDKIPPITSSH